MAECKCGQIPANIKIIKVGVSEVGIPDLNRIIRDVYFKRFSDEVRIKEELLNQVRQKIIIPDEKKDLYSEALFQEYLHFAERLGKGLSWKQAYSGGSLRTEGRSQSGKPKPENKFKLSRFLKMIKAKLTPVTSGLKGKT